MDTRGAPRILPMKTAGTQHFIERTYREGGAFQWVRETYRNAEEANASRVEYGLEWQAVDNLGVYRRLISDDGCGMTAEELVEFFNTFGGGGKPIGGVHENFGVGAKTSLLPWNRHGVVVVSWVDGDVSMIWVQADPESGEYGLKLVETIDEDGDISLDEVYEPYDDDDYGCNWAAVKPEWIDDHGTVIVLLGNDPADDTVLGDPNRAESDIKGVSTYLNRRLWEIRAETEVYVDELRTEKRSQWPRSDEEAHGPQPSSGIDRRTNLRWIRGAKHYITYPVQAFKGGTVKASGSIALTDGTCVDWYLWEGARPAIHSYAAIGGYIGALYENELYDVTSHHSTYRSFGITEREVRSRVWLIIRPPLLDENDGRHGVYPRTDRNALLLKGGPDAGGPLPINDWAAAFADQMPEAILDAIKKARAGGAGSITDPTWRQRLIDRFGSRWRIPKLRARKGGPFTLNATQAGSRPAKAKRTKQRGSTSRGGTGGRSGARTIGSTPGVVPAARTRVAGGLPSYRLVTADEVGPGMLAAWAPNDPTEPSGAVLINIEHPVIEAEIEYWQGQYPDHLADEIRDEVLAVYGEIGVAKVAHSEHLKGIIPAKTVEDDLRSDTALTMALLGLIGEEAVIAPRVGGKFRKRRPAA